VNDLYLALKLWHLNNNGSFSDSVKRAESSLNFTMAINQKRMCYGELPTSWVLFSNACQTVSFRCSCSSHTINQANSVEYVAVFIDLSI